MPRLPELPQILDKYNCNKQARNREKQSKQTNGASDVTSFFIFTVGSRNCLKRAGVSRKGRLVDYLVDVTVAAWSDDEAFHYRATNALNDATTLKPQQNSQQRWSTMASFDDDHQATINTIAVDPVRSGEKQFTFPIRRRLEEDCGSTGL